MRVHQAELEIQNEEMRQAQAELAEARDLYFDLYELAPVGYLSIDTKGFVTRANLTAASLLGLDRSALLQRRLSSFIDSEGADTCRLFRKALTDSGSKQTCEVELAPGKGPRHPRPPGGHSRVGSAGELHRTSPGHGGYHQAQEGPRKTAPRPWPKPNAAQWN